MSALRLVCEKCGRSMDYDRAIDPAIPTWVATLSQSHCDADDCDTGDRHVEAWLDADGVARDPLMPASVQPDAVSADARSVISGQQRPNTNKAPQP